MALFQYNNILLPYQIHYAPFSYDLLLLQGSRFNSDYWLPVLNDWKESNASGGRVITCDWQDEGLTGGDLAEFFDRFFKTLGVHAMRAVGTDDAAKVIQDLESDFPGVVEKSLLFPRNAPRGADLKKAVEDFSTA